MGIKNIGIIGMGNVGQALAGYLSSRQYCIYLYNRSSNKVNVVLNRKHKIQLKGALNCEGTIFCVSDKLEDVVPYCDILFITVPADSHRDVAEKMVSLLHDGQHIVLVPGRTLGAYKFYKSLCAFGLKSNVVIAETSTVFFACRLVDDGFVQIYSRKNYVELSVLNKNPSDCFISEIMAMFPEIEVVESTLRTGLSNIGMVFHPAPFLFNLPRIEQGESFYYYKDGISPIIASYIEKIDKERIMVGEYFGISIDSARQWLIRTYGAKGDTLFSCIQSTDAYSNVMAPEKIFSRYVFEDISSGLVTLVQLGDYLNLDLQYSKLIINLANQIYDLDFYNRGQQLDGTDIKKIITNTERENKK